MFKMFVVFSQKNKRNFLDLYNNVKEFKDPSSLTKWPIIFFRFSLNFIS